MTFSTLLPVGWLIMALEATWKTTELSDDLFDEVEVDDEGVREGWRGFFLDDSKPLVPVPSFLTKAKSGSSDSNVGRVKVWISIEDS